MERCHSERSEESPQLLYQGTAEILPSLHSGPPAAPQDDSSLRIGPAALLVFLSTAAGTGIIPPRARVRFGSLSTLSQHLHDIRRRTALPEFGRHELNVRVDVFKE
jgi:hypothetical protein